MRARVGCMGASVGCMGARVGCMVARAGSLANYIHRALELIIVHYFRGQSYHRIKLRF